MGLIYNLKMILKYIFIFFILLTPTFLLADPWLIDQDDNFITLKKNGEIQHGNNIHFNFDRNNGCKFNVFFFIYTMQDIQKPLWKIYEERSIDLILGGTPISGLLSYSSEFGLGQIAGIYVSRDVPLSEHFIDITEEMLEGNFMKMRINLEHHQYFDIPDEQWDFTNIKTHLNKAHSICVAQLI